MNSSCNVLMSGARIARCSKWGGAWEHNRGRPMKQTRRKNTRNVTAALMLEKLRRGEDVRQDKVRKIRAALRRGDYLTDFKLTLTSDRVLDVLSE